LRKTRAEKEKRRSRRGNEELEHTSLEKGGNKTTAKTLKNKGKDN
jgi:hypothetical protein